MQRQGQRIEGDSTLTTLNAEISLSKCQVTYDSSKRDELLDKIEDYAMFQKLELSCACCGCGLESKPDGVKWLDKPPRAGEVRDVVHVCNDCMLKLNEALGGRLV